MALGGVATGNIKAHEAPRPIIIDNPNGGKPNWSDIVINKGTNKAALAVLEVNSVKNTIKNDTTSPIVK